MQKTKYLVIGMAGSGKTTLMQRLNMHVHQHKIPSYIINLDPGKDTSVSSKWGKYCTSILNSCCLDLSEHAAVSKVPYGANIDIRDTVNYKEVMKQYSLGPNGYVPCV